MPRRATAHDLADHARCPRAWWYQRHEEAARLDAPALEERMRAHRAALGRRAGRDPGYLLLERLLERQRRFAGGRAAHLADARRGADARRARAVRLALAAALLLLALAVALALHAR